MSRFLTKILNEPPGGRQKAEESTLSTSTSDSLSNLDSPSIVNRPTIVDAPSTTDSPSMETSLSTDQPPPPASGQAVPCGRPNQNGQPVHRGQAKFT